MTPSPRALATDPGHLLAMGLGAGLLPIAPGTAGTLLAIPCAWWLAQYGTVIYLIITGVLFGFGVWLCERTGRALAAPDHNSIVWDEIVGYLVTMAMVPATLINLMVGFILFRIFDILKPWPVGTLERRLQGGWGVMMDDIAAGALAAVILWVFVCYGTSLF